MSSLRRLFRYMQPYRWVVIIGIVTVILPVAMEILVPRVLQNIIDDGIRQGEMSEVVNGSVIMLIAAVVGAITTLGQGVCRAQLSQGIAFDMRNDLYQHIQSLPFSTLDQVQTGGLMTRISSDIDLIRMFSSSGLALMLRALLMILGSILMILLIDWQLSMVMILSLGIAAVLIWIFMQTARPLFSVVQQRLGKLNTVIQENLAAAQVVKAYVREQYEIDRFETSNQSYMQQNIRVGRILALVNPTLTILTNMGIVAVIWYGGLDVIGGRLTLGELIAFTNYLMIGMTPLLLLGNMVNMAARAEASAERVLELFDTPPQTDAGANAFKPDKMRGHIVFDQVVFGYADNANNNERRNVLNNVSFEIVPGERVAILGSTGTGKTTLISLISRFYDVNEGRILIDGEDVRNWNIKALRSQIGAVSQDNLLFSGTVQDNVGYGKPDAPFAEIQAAAEMAQAHEFISQMEGGYDGIIEARGANLSGGQKQRTSIARALLIKPAILILDDSTSAVDLETEFKIQDALDAYLAETTTIVIAQRINSVLNADKIIVLDAGGRINAIGTHHQLMQTCTIYQEIYQSQLGDGQVTSPNGKTG